MILFRHTAFDAANIRSNLGMPEYSYYFVQKAFTDAMAAIGEVRTLADPELELDAAAARARSDGHDCAFLSFNPPQYVQLGRDCPTIPVFAWEYDRIPDESWTANPQDDWRVTLAATRCAIVHCSSAAEAVRREMGADFAVWSIPAPVYDRHKHRAADAKGWQPQTTLQFDGGLVIDAGRIDVAMFSPVSGDEQGVRALRLARQTYADPAWKPRPVDLQGVVYTAVFNTADGRKNWEDVVGAFVFAFREEPRATLILKITHSDMFEGVLPVLAHISKLGRFESRILLVHGLLTDEAYSAMVGVTSFAVNASYGEGQCLPLMEFMSAGRPALAPNHTAMADYVRPNNAFVIESDPVLAAWPHDPRDAKRCLHHQPSFPSLVAAYRESFRVARDDPGRYDTMSQAASFALLLFCSDARVTARLREAVNYACQLSAPAPIAARDVGIRDLKLKGWFDDIAGELAPGFTVSARDVVVDVGSDDDGMARFCGERGAHVVLADADKARVAAKRATVSETAARRIDAHVLSAVAPLPFADDFASRIICDQLIERADDPERLMAELARIGRPGARYLLAITGEAFDRVQRQIFAGDAPQDATHVCVLDAPSFEALVERHGLVIDRRSEEGFFWSVWRTLHGRTDADFDGRDPVIDGWTATWSDMIDGPEGNKIMAALDAVMPRHCVVIARKPGDEPVGATARLRGLLTRLFGRGEAR